MVARRVAHAMAAASLLLCGGICAAQSTHPEDLAQGSILVMQRDAPDPLFAHSVIVLARHEKNGTVGLMLHYRSEIPIQRALKGIAGADKRNDAMFVGGPVELASVMALMRSDARPSNTDPVAGRLYLAASKEGIVTALSEGRKPADVRMFLGYAGWGPGQLAREVRLGGWWIFSYEESVVFDEHPETLWERLIKRTELLKAWKEGQQGRRRPAG